MRGSQTRSSEETSPLEATVVAAWTAWSAAPDDRRAKAALVNLLSANPELVIPAMHDDLIALLLDHEVDPEKLAPAGWLLVRRTTLTGAPPQIEPDDEYLTRKAETLEGERLVLALLEHAILTNHVVERDLTTLRRWLLLFGRWSRFPKFVAALAAQTALNEGAWPFDSAEKRRLTDCAGTPMERTYLPPPRAAVLAPDDIPTIGMECDEVMRAVARQYEDHPYPRWQRISRPEPKTFAEYMRPIWPEGAGALPDRPRILVAGCGTGRQVALWATRLRDASITALDVSYASLAYARSRCEQLGLGPIRFVHGDLRRVAALGSSFDLIACGGVLQHLPDPEAGWAKLLRVLAPGGMMDVAVYSRLAHLPLEAARALVADLVCDPAVDDVLRAARRRLLDLPQGHAATIVYGYREFYSLTGIRDILFPASKYLFDIAQLDRALRRLGLRFLGFRVRDLVLRGYDEHFPNDPRRRDLRRWRVLERQNPLIFSSMYQFFCCIEGAGVDFSRAAQDGSDPRGPGA